MHNRPRSACITTVVNSIGPNEISAQRNNSPFKKWRIWMLLRAQFQKYGRVSTSIADLNARTLCTQQVVIKSK